MRTSFITCAKAQMRVLRQSHLTPPIREDGPYTTGQIAQWPRLESSCHAFQFHQCRRRRTVVKGTLGYIFQDLNHFEAECAVRVRPSAAHAAFDEVFDF